MTSSLVGSEMCIRDSPNKNGAWILSDHARRNSQLPTVFFVLPTAPYTVSYTHLTLPTICSV
eukprot:5052460-Prorocentrum_lima.AAC.1